MKLVTYIFLVLTLFSANLTESISPNPKKGGQHPVTDFSRHLIVKPLMYGGTERKEIFSTRQENGEHVNNLLVSLQVDGEHLELDLTLNKPLIPKGFFHNFQENGTYKTHKPRAQEIDLCQYTGKVQRKPESWVAVSTCNGISGVFFYKDELHYIEKEKNIFNSNNADKHILYKHSNYVKHNKTCEEGKDNVLLRHRRETDRKVRGPYNSNSESKYVELVLVVDNGVYRKYEENKDYVINRAITLANILNEIYKPLNVFIALVGVVVWTEKEEIDYSRGEPLPNFITYRKEQLVDQHPNDNAQLLTSYKFENSVVGKATVASMCFSSSGVTNDHSTIVGLVASTMAHEMGHNFGMDHDTDSCDCPAEICIMGSGGSHWSSCSENYLLEGFKRGLDFCLKNKPEELIQGPTCGNDFLEPGEECDCGTPKTCDNSCCNATTCLLQSNATCGTGECCDLTTCDFKKAGTLCRSTNGDCDLPEYCIGESEFCPDDFHKLNTEVCNDGKARCFDGVCRTRNEQCQRLWGETSKTNDDNCYNMNTKGMDYGNCGYDDSTKSFVKCKPEDILCGTLHCEHSSKIPIWTGYNLIYSHGFRNAYCLTVIFDWRYRKGVPSYAPDGAFCGEGKICVNQQCTPIELISQGDLVCPQGCNGNGWCNNNGHCHCKNGFGPPSCDSPGFGGSIDSGPACDPHVFDAVVTAIYIFFLGIVPLAAIIALLVFYGRQRCYLTAKKSSHTTYTSQSEQNHSTKNSSSILPNFSARLKKQFNFKSSATVSAPTPDLNIESNNISIVHYNLSNKTSEDDDIDAMYTNITTVDRNVPLKGLRKPITENAADYKSNTNEKSDKKQETIMAEPEIIYATIAEKPVTTSVANTNIMAQDLKSNNLNHALQNLRKNYVTVEHIPVNSSDEAKAEKPEVIYANMGEARQNLHKKNKTKKNFRPVSLEVENTKPSVKNLVNKFSKK